MRSKTATVSYPDESIVLKVPKINSLDTSSPRPFWSVMIPVYNPPLPYLEETLRCVLDQDAGADQMQIEVIDDASPNGAPTEFIRKLAGERVTVHCEPRNLGLAGIWNRCIERARGEWVHILHQDDLIYPGFYKLLQQGIQAFPSTGAAFTRHIYCNEIGEQQHLSRLELAQPGILKDALVRLVNENRIVCASIVVKKSTYQAVGRFDSRLTHAIDWEMWIRIANQFPIFYEPTILAAWRQHSTATTSGQIRSGENIRDIARAIRIWRKYLPPEKENDMRVSPRTSTQRSLWTLLSTF